MSETHIGRCEKVRTSSSPSEMIGVSATGAGTGVKTTRGSSRGRATVATVGASSAKRASDGGCETVSKARSEGEELKEQVSELCEESEKHNSEQVEFDSISK